MERIIFHVDVNNAFLSWTAIYLLEHGYEKDIRKIPSIIGGDEKERKGIVVAKSPIAKKYGIVTAETIYQAKKKCPSLEVFPGNYEWYKIESRKFKDYLRQYSPNIEEFSIDECFVDMTGTNYLYNDYVKLAYKIKDDIYKAISDLLKDVKNKSEAKKVKFCLPFSFPRTPQKKLSRYSIPASIIF